MTTFRTTGYAGVPTNPLYSGGKKLKTVFAVETVTAAENANGDVWILSGPHSLDDQIVAIIGASPAFTSATDNDFGFYKKLSDGTFSAIDADILVDGGDLSSALTHRDLLNTLNTSLDTTKTIGQHLGLHSDDMPEGGVYLAMTMNTASSATSERFVWQVLISEATNV